MPSGTKLKGEERKSSGKIQRKGRPKRACCLTDREYENKKHNGIRKGKKKERKVGRGRSRFLQLSKRRCEGRPLTACSPRIFGQRAAVSS